MKLTLVHFQSEEEIDLDAKDPVIIGRGSLLGCSDKKVSRNHGQIQITPEGNVHLLALHTNPCFFMKNGLPPVYQLAKDEEKILNNGDYIGLLPDSFWYKIVLKNNDLENGFKVPGESSNALGNECQPCGDGRTEGRTNQIGADFTLSLKCDQEPDHNTSKVTAEDGLLKTSAPNDNVTNDIYELAKTTDAEDVLVKAKKDDEVKKATESDNEPIGVEIGEKGQLDSTKSWLAERMKALEKTKKLPLSMYEIDDFPDQVEEFNWSQEEFNVPFEYNETKPAESGDKLGQNLTDSPFSTDTTLCDRTSGRNTHEEESNGNKAGERSDCVAHSSKEKVSELTTFDIDNTTKDIYPNSTSQKRPICQYEEKCYRKNKEHRREFCHPGDEDFIPYTNRPKCQYGSSCYRKNKTHHIEYQHPKSKKTKGKSPTDSPKRKRQKKEEEMYIESSEEDDYSWEDPFADDGSSDEYIPSDLNSDDDMDDLMSESASVPTPR